MKKSNRNPAKNSNYTNNSIKDIYKTSSNQERIEGINKELALMEVNFRTLFREINLNYKYYKVGKNKNVAWVKLKFYIDDNRMNELFYNYWKMQEDNGMLMRQGIINGYRPVKSNKKGYVRLGLAFLFHNAEDINVWYSNHLAVLRDYVMREAQ